MGTRGREHTLMGVLTPGAFLQTFRDRRHARVPRAWKQTHGPCTLRRTDAGGLCHGLDVLEESHVPRTPSTAAA